ncbi:DNA-processing protein DprA [Taibaiella soli]|uniref:Smf/DprA SLOG domain-containing protein n=1 Tax=Taibaiella soli TaxID=1649169 RepID=A0A2W2B8J5_9BACT|nr:DNA-processing protein DprA [Taibaiella soli]PZF72609.1 hypothetical protein DN068_12140 [Taibaiella soli]
MDKQFILTLLNTKDIGKGTVRKLLDKSIKPSSTKDLIDYLEDLRAENKRVKVPTLDNLNIGEEKAEQILSLSENNSIRILSVNDAQFPERYRRMPDGPVMIHVKGNLECLNEQTSVAIIGTREPSDYGVNIGKRYGQVFAEKKIAVISGLAKGCDTAGHEGCLAGNGTTIAILAGGLDKIYPKENTQLADRILASGGALISEYQIGTPAQGNFFVERDRLQSGLSKALLVIETDIKGGSMHTVGFAQKQGVPVYFDYTRVAEENRMDFHKFQGNRDMIEGNKAKAIKNGSDLNELIDFIISTPSNIGNGGIIDSHNNQMTMF